MSEKGVHNKARKKQKKKNSILQIIRKKTLLNDLKFSLNRLLSFLAMNN